MITSDVLPTIAIRDYLFGTTDHPTTVIQELKLVQRKYTVGSKVYSIDVRKYLVEEVMYHWPKTVARLKTLVAALRGAGVIDNPAIIVEKPSLVGGHWCVLDKEGR